ncbi:biotin-dependent carboxyltransferase family protein [Paenibacillus sp. 1P07SE]|uniref:5-oxoprolinase subunit C family protein n=1 Tax=Paenibacillus sp. 1P07SE TaxID=3132209 RepID=UPI0039A6CB89
MSLRVMTPGLFTTIQDLGRTGLRHTGLAAGGAMDEYALRIGNLLVGNPEGAAGLEMTLTGAELLAGADMLVAVCGAYMSPHVDGEEVPTWRPLWLARGARLRLGRAVIGCRGYVTVAGGITVPTALGGRGTDVRAAIGGIAGRALTPGDTLPAYGAAGSPWASAWAAALAAQARAAGRSWAAPPWWVPPAAYGGGDAPGGIVLRAMPGRESGQFSAAAREAFYREPYRVAPASDRMGCRLGGPMLERTSRAELLSHGVAPGVVQVPPGGQPIVLTADCQTTGGYPCIAHVASADLPLLAQAKPGDYVRFQPVTLAEAQELDRLAELSIRHVAIGLQGRLP